MSKKTKQTEQNLIVSTSHIEDFVEISINDKGSDDVITIDVRNPRCMYVTIGNKVIYIDYTLDDLIVTSWKLDNEATN